MNKNRLKKSFSQILSWLAIASTVLTILTFFVDRERILGSLSGLMMFAPYLMLVLGLWAVWYAWIKRIEVSEVKIELQQVRSELDALRSSLYPDKSTLSFKRFENVARLEYGHIDYKPFLYYQDGYPEGLGPAILRAICGEDVELVDLNERSTWDGFLDDIDQGRFDLAGTLLFETAERCRRVAFTKPLFYSDIGIYVRADHEYWDGRLREEGLAFGEAIELLNSVGGRLNARVIPGEISERLVVRHIGRLESLEVQQLEKDRASVPSLIESVSRMSERSDVVFAEAFQADRTRAVKSGKVVNMLQSFQLMYPVGFAVRRQEYVLRHFLNLRLLALEDNGLYSLIHSELERAGMATSMEKIRRYYVRNTSSEPPPKPDLLRFTDKRS